MTSFDGGKTWKGKNKKVPDGAGSTMIIAYSFQGFNTHTPWKLIVENAEYSGKTLPPITEQIGSSSHLVKVGVWVVILMNGLFLPFAFRARLRIT